MGDPYCVHLETLLIITFPPDPHNEDYKDTLRIYPRKGRLTPWEQFLNNKKNLTLLRNIYILYYLRVNAIVLRLFSSLLWPLENPIYEPRQVIT